MAINEKGIKHFLNKRYVQPLYYYLTVLRESPHKRAVYDFEAHNLMLEKINMHYKNYLNNKLNVIDLGCGKHYPHTLLFSMDGHQVTGIDMAYIIKSPSIKSYIKSLKLNGFLETARYLQLDLMKKREQYFNFIESFKKEKISDHLNMEFIRDDAERIEKIEDSSVDLVISKDVFEHLRNPDNAIKRTFEILKVGGLCLHIIHLYASISGGHNPHWDNFSKYEPWDHLRKEKVTLPFAYLNRLTASDYIRSFKKYFTTTCFEYHSFTHLRTQKSIEGILTQDIYNEILVRHPNLNKRDLLNEKLIVLAKRDH